MRSSGHESFPCRYTWIPKVFSSLQANPLLFADDADAMVQLGLGKNMVRALRFWTQLMGVAHTTDRTNRVLQLTPFAKAIFDLHDGWDPYLEDVQTLWLLHWNLTSHSVKPLLAWDYLFFHRPSNAIVRTSVIRELMDRAKTKDMRATKVTIKQHFDVFLHTYVPSRGKKAQVLEDNLDCPLVELRLIEHAGEKVWDTGEREPVYAFRQEEKPEISAGLFMYCLHHYWNEHAQERTLSLREIVSGVRSPGTILRLPEADIRARLERIEQDSHGYFVYTESVNIQHVERTADLHEAPDFLAAVYAGEISDG